MFRGKGKSLIRKVRKRCSWVDCSSHPGICTMGICVQTLGEFPTSFRNTFSSINSLHGHMKLTESQLPRSYCFINSLTELALHLEPSSLHIKLKCFKHSSLLGRCRQWQSLFTSANSFSYGSHSAEKAALSGVFPDSGEFSQPGLRGHVVCSDWSRPNFGGSN